MSARASRLILERDISLTFAKGMSVLKAFDAANTHLTLPQIGRITGLDRATTRRLVLTLVHLGYVQQNERVFSLTPRILVLAGGFLQGRQFGKTVQPVLRAFSHRIGEPISMAMIDGYEAVYVAHAGGDTNTISIGFTVGSRLPLLPTSIGRALVAFSAPALRDDLIRNAPLQKFTAATVEDRDMIMKDITLTAERGYAFVDGEFEIGVAAIALPARTSGPEVAALGVSAASARFKEERFQRTVLETLSECSSAVSGLI
jgi:IclR family pca regulon transcriptional regulator